MIKRDLNIDIMRIIACIMIIIIHVSSELLLNFNPSTYTWNISNIFDSLSISAVPIFVMITGILLLNPKKEISIKRLYLKYIPKMILVLFIASLFYSLWYCFGLHMYNFSLGNYIKYTIIGPYHLWYFSVIFFLYIITPVAKIVTSSDKNNISKYILGILIISSILYTIQDCRFMPYFEYINLLLEKMYYKNILFWGSYYLIGHYIYNTNELDKYKRIIYVLGIVGLFFCITLTRYDSIKYNTYNFPFYNNFGFPVYVMSIALIYLMKNIKIKHKKIIDILSKSTFGIYIIHLFVLQLLNTSFHVYTLKLNTVFLIPLISILVFVISLMVVLIFSFLKNVCIIKQHKHQT